MAQSIYWDPQRYAETARFVSDLGAPLIDMLAPGRGERILDLGCGDGALTERIATQNCAVIGIDTSPAQLRAARERGLQVALMDGHNLGFKPAFDAVFTNAALHWMKQHDEVVGGVWRILKPGGRFVGEFGGQGNVETIRRALHAGLKKRGLDPQSIDPWVYPSAEQFSSRLARAGFTVTYIALIPRPTKLPTDITAWLELFAQIFINAVIESERPKFLTELARGLEPDLRGPDGHWFADYVRLRFAAAKPR
jgi:trans-aconitate methyltransferase